MREILALVLPESRLGSPDSEQLEPKTRKTPNSSYRDRGNVVLYVIYNLYIAGHQGKYAQAFGIDYRA